MASPGWGNTPRTLQCRSYQQPPSGPQRKRKGKSAKEYAFSAEQTYFADGAINVPLQFWESIDVNISKGATVTVTSADGSDSRTVAIRPEE